MGSASAKPSPDNGLKKWLKLNSQKDLSEEFKRQIVRNIDQKRGKLMGKVRRKKTMDASIPDAGKSAQEQLKSHGFHTDKSLIKTHKFANFVKNLFQRKTG